MLQCFQYPFEILDATLKEEEQGLLWNGSTAAVLILVATVQYREGISQKNVNRKNASDGGAADADGYLPGHQPAIRLCSHHDDKIRASVTVHTYVAVNDQQDVLDQEAVHICSR